MPATNVQRLILFGPTGDSIAETGGTIWDLVANSGTGAEALDPSHMTVVQLDGAVPVRTTTLGTALQQQLDPEGRVLAAESLRRRAEAMERLADWIDGLAITPGGAP